jgi:hypothetical protein
MQGLSRQPKLRRLRIYRTQRSTPSGLTPTVSLESSIPSDLWYHSRFKIMTGSSIREIQDAVPDIPDERTIRINTTEHSFQHYTIAG